MLLNDRGNTANPGNIHGKGSRKLVLSLGGIVFLVSRRVVYKTQYVSVSRIVSVDLVHALVCVTVNQMKWFKLNAFLLRGYGRRRWSAD